MKNRQKDDHQKRIEDLYKNFKIQIEDLRKKQDEVLRTLQKKVEEYKKNEILDKIKD